MKIEIKKCVKCGFHKSKQVTRTYDRLIEQAKERKKLLSQMQELKFKYNTYDDTLSDADEFPYSKDDLDFKMYLLQEDIKRTEIF